MDPILDADVETYLHDLTHAQHDDPVLDELEDHARRLDFPIVGRTVGRLLEQQARAVRARRVFEIGSGFGYSAYWFARAVGDGGTVVCTERSADHAASAERFLTHADLWDRVDFRVGDASDTFSAVDGAFDVVFCDADKERYPDHWRAAADRIEVGGLYVADNTLWDGRVATGEAHPTLPGSTEALIEHNRLVAEDRRYVTSLVPIRDGVLVALRVV